MATDGLQMVEQRRVPPAVVIEAVRALAAINDSAAVPVLFKIVGDPEANALLRREYRAPYKHPSEGMA